MYPHSSSSSRTVSPSSSDEDDFVQRRKEALNARSTCTTPSFNQSNKFSKCQISAAEAPSCPILQQGKGFGSLRNYTDYKSTLGSSEVLPKTVSRKPSRLFLKLKPSKSSFKSNDEVSLVTTTSSSSSSSHTPDLNDNPFPLPPMFSPCTSPIDEYFQERVSAPPQARFRIRRKPVPAYPETEDLSSSSAESSASETDGFDSDDLGSPQLVGPNVFIAYDAEPVTAATSAFTHVVRITGSALRAVSFNSQTTARTLTVSVGSPGSSSASSFMSELSNYLPVIADTHQHIDFSHSKTPHRKLYVRRKPVPVFLNAFEKEDDEITLEDSLLDMRGKKPWPSISYSDLLATQSVLPSSELLDVAHLLSDPPFDDDQSEFLVTPVVLQRRHIQSVLDFLRPHPFAPDARKRVLFVVPRDRQLALEGLLLAAAYVTHAERRNLDSVLRKFDRISGTVVPPWRLFRGDEDEIAMSHLEQLISTVWDHLQ
ncbi:unnamed protein product [Mycena citricolor]|uniref:Uncharacterized protein n=1 Tax=Mycena citricolor TaxID=2018698 RepID=A0AAD2K0H5_9AGAR|nr:unnamed protein product [Mycena citricolor]